MIKIEDMTVSKELDVSEMSTVRGGLLQTRLTNDNYCTDVGATLQSAAAEGGIGAMIVAAAEIGSGQTPPVCPA
ncbi:MAG TPA: hypothetical protein VEK10_12405 [Steroidobacteraceae bacterium]|nr:hypothetical protein [Steroidobacteraceae bacterium]